MKTTKVLFLAAATAWIALNSSAQNTRPTPPRGGRPPQGENADRPHPPMPPLVAALDADKDGTLSADEIANASSALLSLDKNKDGKLDLDEIRPALPAGAPPRAGGPRPESPAGDGEQPGHPGRRPMGPPLIGALDVDHDGVISAEELNQAPANLLKLDRNGDGKLTPDEYMGRGPGHGRGPEHRPAPDHPQAQN